MSVYSSCTRRDSFAMFYLNHRAQTETLIYRVARQYTTRRSGGLASRRYNVKRPFVHLLSFVIVVFYHMITRKAAARRIHVVFSIARCATNTCSSKERLIESNARWSLQHIPADAIQYLDVPTEVVESNEFDVPYIEALYRYAYRVYPYAATYTYVNSDILLNLSLYHTIEYISKRLKGQPFMVVGRRVDVVWKNQVVDHAFNFEEAIRSGNQSRLDAIDYFITTRNAMDWNKIPKFVIGRPAYDNWLVNYAMQSDRVVLIDASKTIDAIHQSFRAGLDHWESMSNVEDRDYNRRLGHGSYKVGYISITSCQTYRVSSSLIKLTRTCTTGPHS